MPEINEVSFVTERRNAFLFLSSSGYNSHVERCLMKLLIASDIHGSSLYCEQLMEAYKEEKPDKVLFLGDILYHGPRNDLPDVYDTKAVVKMLNSIADQILCVCGNCDCDVDQMVLNFPILSDYALLYIDGVTIYATHGHVYNQNNKLPGMKGILLCGHTHVPAIEEYEDFTYLNPGSVSIPKKGSKHSYMVFENGTFLWKDLETRQVYQEYVTR